MTAILVSANSGMVWRMRITAPAACSSSVKVGADMLGVVYGVEWGGREGVASRQVGMDGGCDWCELEKQGRGPISVYILRAVFARSIHRSVRYCR